MEMTNNRRVLKLASVLDFISGVPTALFGAASLIGAGAVAANPELITDASEGAGLTAILGGGGLLFLVIGVLSIVVGVLAWRAAQDSSKIMPAWYAAAAMLAIQVVSTVVSAAMFHVSIGGLVSLAFSGLVFYAANNMKKEAGF